MKPDDIRRIRKSIFRLSQPEFAKLMGTCVAQVSRWESGKAQPTGMQALLVEAIKKVIDNYGENRIRGVDWAAMMDRSVIHAIAGVLNFATIPTRTPVDKNSK